MQKNGGRVNVRRVERARTPCVCAKESSRVTALITASKIKESIQAANWNGTMLYQLLSSLRRERALAPVTPQPSLSPSPIQHLFLAYVQFL